MLIVLLSRPLVVNEFKTGYGFSKLRKNGNGQVEKSHKVSRKL